MIQVAEKTLNNTFYSNDLLENKLKFTTFLNNLPIQSQNAFFKACTHPSVVTKIKEFIATLKSFKEVSFYDPYNNLPAFASLYDLSDISISNIYVQQIKDVGKKILGIITKPADEINLENNFVIFAFDAATPTQNVKHLLPANCNIITLDAIKLSNEYLTKPNDYLNQLNFATNFAFLRDEQTLHTRISMVNYWGLYGAKDVKMNLWLFDQNGIQIANWVENLAQPGCHFIIDSREVKKRFNLPDFTGSLFMHATNITGHDIVKYVCDVFDEKGEIHSVTHDSNSWPADYYAGIPAPQQGERVILWIQNCHPITIQPNSIALRLMGGDNFVYLQESIEPFATYAWDLGASYPAVWPQQYEIIAQKYFTRPRFEVLQANNCRYISHANVERVDLSPDKDLIEASKYLGKGFILPFPIMPINIFDTIILPTPMATGQQILPINLYIYNNKGKLVLEKNIPPIARNESVAIDIVALLSGTDFVSGHVQLAYDEKYINYADGWLHALARYRNTNTGQAAETSFGAHIYNMPIVYKGEPQTYKGNPPGLRTTLVLRVVGGEDTFCNLIYPCSKDWLKNSTTNIILFNEQGSEITKKSITIPANGSHLWTYKEMFTTEERTLAGENAYLVIKDTTCRLFGFHGQVNHKDIFSLDHMFGF